MTAHESCEFSGACVLTPPGRGAVATILVQGPLATLGICRCFLTASGRAFDLAGFGHVVYGRWMQLDGEELVACRVNEQTVELHCHGGLAATSRILADLAEQGIESVDWRELAEIEYRDSIRAEALIGLGDATTARTAAILWDQCSGALERALSDVQELLNAQDVAVAIAAVQELLQRAKFGLHLTAPWRVAIVGRPNVGKSSLLNAFVGYGRAIVHDEPGTTRDLVSATTALDGWPCELTDTAGLRDASEPIERAGIALAADASREADLVLWVRDVTASREDAGPELPSFSHEPLVVWNKSDMLTAEESRPAEGVCISARNGDGLDMLMRAIIARLVPVKLERGAAVPFTRGQVARLHAIAGALAAENMAEAGSLLGEWLAAQRHGALPGEI